MTEMGTDTVVCADALDWLRGRELPATREFFNRAPGRKTRLHSWCRECCARDLRERRARKLLEAAVNDEHETNWIKHRDALYEQCGRSPKYPTLLKCYWEE